MRVKSWLWIVLAATSCSPPPLPPPATPAPSEESAEPAPKAELPAGDAAYFPLIAGATYDYDTVYTGVHKHIRRIVRTTNTSVGPMFYFVDSGAEDENPSVGPNAFGLGVYRLTSEGIETADVYFLEEAAKISGTQLIVQFPLQQGATTTTTGKKLETTVAGPETITVPAGTFACMRFDQREIWPSETYEGGVWLARGVGTVKRVFVTGRTETLTAYKLGK